MKRANKLVKDEVARKRPFREIFKARYAELTHERFLILSIFSYFQRDSPFMENHDENALIGELQDKYESRKSKEYGLCLNWKLFGQLIELMSNEVSEMRVGLDTLPRMEAEGKVTSNEDTDSNLVNPACGKFDAVILRLRDPTRAEEVKAYFKEIIVELFPHPVVLMWNPFTNELLISP